jgi:hypothetical protein
VRPALLDQGSEFRKASLQTRTAPNTRFLSAGESSTLLRYMSKTTPGTNADMVLMDQQCGQ